MAMLKTLLRGLVLIAVLGIAAQGTSAPTTGTSAPTTETSAPTKGAEEKPKPDDKKKKDAAAKDAVKVIKRPTSPPAPPDPEELKAAPDKSGLVQFRFQGQPWPAVLEWLADISSMSLDWQELPGDYLNLSTRRGYRVDEVRDLINERLLARGYTLLRQSAGLTIVKIKDLDSGMVPRIKPEELAKRDCPSRKSRLKRMSRVNIWHEENAMCGKGSPQQAERRPATGERRRRTEREM